MDSSASGYEIMQMTQAMIENMSCSRVGGKMRDLAIVAPSRGMKSEVISSRRSPSSYYAQSKGLHFLDKQALWTHMALIGHRAALADILELITMQNERIGILNDNILKLERGLPRQPEHPEEIAFYSQLTAQWKSVLKRTKDLDDLYKMKRGQKLSAEVSELAREVMLRREEVLQLLGVVSGLQAHLKMLYKEFGTNLDKFCPHEECTCCSRQNF